MRKLRTPPTHRPLPRWGGPGSSYTSSHSPTGFCPHQPFFLLFSPRHSERKGGLTAPYKPALFRNGLEPPGPPEGAKLPGHGSSSSLWPPLQGAKVPEVLPGRCPSSRSLGNWAPAPLASARTSQPLPETGPWRSRA